MNKKKILPSDDKRHGMKDIFKQIEDAEKLDFYELRDEFDIFSFGRGLRFERKPNLERRRVLQLEQEIR